MKIIFEEYGLTIIEAFSGATMITLILTLIFSPTFGILHIVQDFYLPSILGI